MMEEKDISRVKKKSMATEVSLFPYDFPSVTQGNWYIKVDTKDSSCSGFKNDFRERVLYSSGSLG